MQKWDYFVVQCDTFYPTAEYQTKQIVYQSANAVYGKTALDPTFDWPIFDWQTNTWSGKGEWSKGEWSGRSRFGYGGASELRLAWSPSKKCWTYLWKCLEEMGEEGWELVGTTPPLSLPYGGGDSMHYAPIDFCLLFKRPRP